MTWLEALILGVIQGLTEFLPVSSSGHLEIGSVLLGITSGDNLLFAVVVHLATALATLVVYRKDILSIVGDLWPLKRNSSWKFVGWIVLSMIPVGIVGLLFQDQIEAFFTGNMLLVGGALILTSVLLTLSHFYEAKAGELSPLKAFIVGIAQAVAILPGVSRSGATISTALLIGIDRREAARFSFLMVIPPILGAAVLKLKDFLEAPGEHTIEPIALFVGFIAAFVSGFFACTWMIRIVTHGRLLFFAIYCFIVGMIAVLSQVV